jgi:RND family efflux transporter MFP subunit
MKNLVIVVVVAAAALAGTAFYAGMFTGKSAAQAAVEGQGQAGNALGSGGRGRRGGGGFGGGNFGRAPLAVETAIVRRQSIAEQITVVGNLIGEATVSVVPRAQGRLQDVFVRLGDRVAKGQRLAKLEDQDIVEQVRQAEAAQEVSLATIRQREADLKRAQTNAERSRNLFERQLIPRQTLDDNEATYQAAVAQLDLARAQNVQSKARLDELRVTLDNTVVVSPVNGFVAKRSVDAGASVSPNVPVVDVVDITRVRLVVNVVEKDLKHLHSGDAAQAQVDAYSGETFKGQIARLAPVLDPSTRTAQLEIEIPNPDNRLKPGMYARVSIVTNTKKDALVVPVNAVADLGGRRGVFIPQPDNSAVFRTIQVGSEQGDVIEVADGLKEGDRVITTGAGALRDGDRIVLADQGRGGNGRRGEESAAAEGTAPAANAEANRGFSRSGQPGRGQSRPEKAQPGSSQNPEISRRGPQGAPGSEEQEFPRGNEGQFWRGAPATTAAEPSYRRGQ